jgi:transposase-like protein
MNKQAPEEVLRSTAKPFVRPVGRPEIYTQELADKVCEEIAQGYSMRTVCKADGMPNISTLFKWIREKSEFSQQYAKATEERTEAMSEDLLDIADDGSNDLMRIQKGNETYEIENKEVTNRSKLRVDTRKWLMSKMKPKKYGDKLDVLSDGKALVGNTIIFKDFKDETNSQ